MQHQHEGPGGLFHTHTHTHTHTHDARPHSHPAPGVPADPAPRLHLSGVRLPDGDHVDLYLHDGVIGFEPVRDAITLATGGWIMPGLVDAHCHVGLDTGGAVDRATTEQQAITDRDTGTLLIRDAGSPADTRWIDDRADLPRMIRAGRHIARPGRYIRNFAAEVDPDQLVAEVLTQAARGDGWVKLVGDWIDRTEGDLAPLWPAAVAERAIAAAHQVGARVTAHCFGEESVRQLVAAGIDGIEHGTGLDADTIDQMARRSVALVPTMINLATFEQIAASAQAKFPVYAAHMRDLHARHRAVLAAAREAGVPVFAGTDAGGALAHGRIADEIEALGGIGDAGFALGAASWRAREWLGMPGIREGASADLVVFDTDPRLDLAAARHPAWVILRGRVVRPAP